MPAITFTTGGALRKSALRLANERLVLAAVRGNSSLSRVDISRITGLSPSSITFIVNRLKRDRILVEEKVENRAQVGRRPTMVRIRSEAMMAIGVEVTAGESRVVLADLDGRLLATRSVPWHENHEVLFSRIHSAIVALRHQAGSSRLLGVGVALPGLMDPATGRIVIAQNLGWFDVEAGRLLRRSLPLPFYYDNNARLSALAERWFCAPNRKALRNFVFVVAREGVGTGVIVDGQILHGARAAAGEFGHATLYPDGKRCLCGNSGCWEQYVSERALHEVFVTLGGTPLAPDTTAPGLAIAGMARRGDPVAIEALRTTAAHVGSGLIHIIRALNPEAIVVGDYLAVAWDLIEDVVWQVLRSRVHQLYLEGLRIVPSDHAIDSSLLGAVALVMAKFLTTFNEGDATDAPHSVLMRTSTG
jgi:predicted NBD/HSP70 family sugar kinase